MKKLYSVHDKRTNFYGQIIQVNHVGEAVRSFEQAVTTTGSLLNSYSSEYELCYMGEFDEVAGLISPLARPEFVVDGGQINVKKQ